MNTVATLNNVFLKQDFPEGQQYADMLDRYRLMASNYAQMENAIAVLSDLHANTSYIYYGRFSQMLGMSNIKSDNKVQSIWEEEIFKLICPDDLAEKHLQELRFFHFIKQQPKKTRADYYLASKIRMKGDSGSYVKALHRIFYIHTPLLDNLCLAMCLYSPLTFDLPAKCVIINSVNGQITELKEQSNAKILSNREKQILNLIDKGMMSKEIANMLSISINTVSRHRQEILNKLQVKNSIEACRIAKDLKLIIE